MSWPPTPIAGLPPFRLDPDAACRTHDPDLFYPDTRGGLARKTVRDAKAVCYGCPVRDQCREWAISHQERGVWGATTDLDRRRIRRQRGLAHRLQRPRAA